jgi:hypothetical protein
MLRVFLYLTSLFILSKSAFAGDYFDFLPPNNLLNYEKTAAVKFFYKLDGYEKSQFLVRPLVENGTAFIFEPIKSQWISGYSLWSEFPALQKTMQIKVTGPEKSQLYFQITNMITGEVYETKKHPLWTINSYHGYLDLLNENILKNRQ